MQRIKQQYAALTTSGIFASRDRTDPNSPSSTTETASTWWEDSSGPKFNIVFVYVSQERRGTIIVCFSERPICLACLTRSQSSWPTRLGSMYSAIWASGISAGLPGSALDSKGWPWILACGKRLSCRRWALAWRPGKASCPAAPGSPASRSSYRQCCGSGIRCLFNPWIRDLLFRIPDPKPIFLRAWWQLFWVKSSTILLKICANSFLQHLKKFFFPILWNLWLQKRYDNYFFFSPLFCCCFWIRDPRSGDG